jgi:hypothetical protein
MLQNVNSGRNLRKLPLFLSNFQRLSAKFPFPVVRSTQDLVVNRSLGDIAGDELGAFAGDDPVHNPGVAASFFAAPTRRREG